MILSYFQVFKAIQKSSMDLLRVIERYQDRLCGELQTKVNSKCIIGREWVSVIILRGISFFNEDT